MVRGSWSPAQEWGGWLLGLGFTLYLSTRPRLAQAPGPAASLGGVKISHSHPRGPCRPLYPLLAYGSSSISSRAPSSGFVSGFCLSEHFLLFYLSFLCAGNKLGIAQSALLPERPTPCIFQTGKRGPPDGAECSLTHGPTFWHNSDCNLFAMRQL